MHPHPFSACSDAKLKRSLCPVCLALLLPGRSAQLCLVRCDSLQLASASPCPPSLVSQAGTLDRSSLDDDHVLPAFALDGGADACPQPDVVDLVAPKSRVIVHHRVYLQMLCLACSSVAWKILVVPKKRRKARPC